MKNIIIILFFLLQGTLTYAQEYIDTMIEAFEKNDSYQLLEYLNIDKWQESDIVIAEQHLKQFMQYIIDERLEMRKVDRINGLHFVKGDTILLSCLLTVKKKSASLSFGPMIKIYHIDLANVKLENTIGTTYISIQRKPFIREHNFMADFDQALKEGLVAQQFTFDSLAQNNFDEFLPIFNDKFYFVPYGYHDKVFSVRGRYFSDKETPEIELLIGYDVLFDKYNVRLFLFEKIEKPNPPIKMKPKIIDDGGLIEEPLEKN